MAKKEAKIDTNEDLINVEPKLVANTEPLVMNISKDSYKTLKINDLSIIDLVYAEKCAKIVCQRYENSIKNYDGSIAQSSLEYNKFREFIDIHQQLLNKMEERLLQLKQ
jgi:hypothetical protein